MQPLSARRRAPLIILIAANSISLVGNVFAMIAVPWFVLETTGSAAQTGITGAFTTLASVAAAFLGGVIVDRLGFRHTSVIADMASGVTVALIPLLYGLGRLEFWHLLVLVFLGALLDAPGNTAREALMPELAELAGMTLEQSGVAIQMVERGARMVGAPLAGLLIALIGTQNVLWLDAGSFAISAVMVGVGVPLLQTHAAAADDARGYLDHLKDGWRFLHGDRLLFATLLLVMILNFLDAPLFGVLYPVYIRQFFDSALNLGLLVALGGAGALLGAFLYGARGMNWSRRAVFFGGFLIVSLRFWVLAAVPPFAAVLAMTFLAGFGAGPINPILMALELERIPAALRGRVLGTITAFAWVAMPLGMLVGGYLLEVFDVRAVLVGIGVAYLSSILAFLFHPATRDMDQRRVAGGAP